ncbi:MAG: HpcH/HpaI aldolase family protein [Vibrio sp.]|uniref:HpcH/HpaI aldolase family protein n=1 Tax=Vibrio sp. TaxID=678 RepID=UPI003A8B0810
MTPAEFKKAIDNGENVYGTLLTVNSPYWLDACKKIAPDFLFIDTEHTGHDIQNLAWMCRGYKEAGITPIVRVPNHDHYSATVAMDAGATGIIFPYLESVEEIKELLSIKYRPLKGEKVKQLIDGKIKLNDTMQKYVENYNKNTTFWVNIESVRAVNNLDDILAIPEIDGVFVGPHDFSCQYEMPEDYHNPEFIELCQNVMRKARAAGKSAGVHFPWADLTFEKLMMDAGSNFIVHAADILMFIDTAVEKLDGLREHGGNSDKMVGKQTQINI